MRGVVQRVSRASVTVNGERIGEIGNGILLLLGVCSGDAEADLDYICRKTEALRIFSDENDKMNLSVADVAGQILVVSQFTLFGDARKGNRPSFIEAAQPETAKELYEKCIKRFRNDGFVVEHGEFGADMKVELLNDGPVTILLDSSKIF